MTSSVHAPSPAVPRAAGDGPDPLARVREAAQELTPQERAALTAHAAGYTQTLAARLLGTSPRTLRRVLTSAVRRLDAADRVHAVALAAACGALDPAALVAREVPEWLVNSNQLGPAAAARRREEFTRIRARGVPVQAAALELGVSEQTGYRYERERLARALAAGGG